MRLILLISLFEITVSAIEPYRFINVKNGIIVKNNTDIYLFCFIGDYEFKVKPNSKSRAYAFSNNKACH